MSRLYRSGIDTCCECHVFKEVSILVVGNASLRLCERCLQALLKVLGGQA